MRILERTLVVFLTLAVAMVWMVGCNTLVNDLYAWVNKPPQKTVEVTVAVKYGDSIDGIILEHLKKYHDTRDIREIRHEVRERNQLSNWTIYPGDTLVIPFEVPDDEK